MAVTKRSYMDILLGLFVAGGLGLLVAFIFLLGQERRLFDTTDSISAKFSNVAGLRVGAEVLLGGVRVGHVSEVQFPPIPQMVKTPGLNDISRKITVVMRVSHSMVPWIRKDSVARIDSEGLLGNKNVNISLGFDPHPPKDGFLISDDPKDLVAEAREAGEQVKSAAKKISEFFGNDSLIQTLNSLKGVANEIEKGDGVIHALIYDKNTGGNFKAGMAGLKKTIDAAQSTVTSIDALLAEIANGKGILHGLIYDKEGEEIVKRANSILKEVESIAGAIRTGTGILHGLVYDDDNGNLVSNLNLVASDLQKIVSRVQGGEGTLGRLLVDPSVYEDLKLILSDVKRNKVLKTLIRFGISVNESHANE